MKPTAILDIQRTGDLGGEKVDMKLDENSLAHLMSIMIDLYSDPELAVLREYSTNALDSQVEAGVTRPIEVDTPGALSPYLKIRDFGLGMDEHDIRNVYSKYGASTKRESNDVVGMLGLGSKSALTYTGQFHIRGVKNGIATLVVVNRNEDGTGVMEIVSIDETDDHNGVEITIPAKHGSSFESKARDFFRFWQPGTVLVNGKAPVFIEGNKVTDNILVVGRMDSDYIVMGNVAYPVNDNSLYPSRGWYSEFNIVAFVEIGDVNFTPSREALNYTKKTRATIGRLADEFQTAFMQQIRDDIDGAGSHSEALEKYSSWYEMVGSQGIPKNLAYKGSELMLQIKADLLVYDTNAARYAVQRHGALNTLDIINNMVYVTGFDPVADRESLTAVNRKKMKHWAENNGGVPDRFILCKNRTGSPWTDNVRTVDWQAIKDIRLPRVPRVKSTGPVKTWKEKFEVFINGMASLTDTIDTNKPVLYASPTDEFDEIRTMSMLFPDATVVKLSRNRWEKFLREYPMAKHLSVVAKEKCKAVLDALTDDDKMVMGLNHYGAGVLQYLNPDNIDDPKVAKAARLIGLSGTSDTINEYNKAQRILPRQYQPRITPSNPKVLDPYPLVLNVYGAGKHARHMEVYINAVYNERKANASI